MTHLNNVIPRIKQCQIYVPPEEDYILEGEKFTHADVKQDAGSVLKINTNVRKEFRYFDLTCLIEESRKGK